MTTAAEILEDAQRLYAGTPGVRGAFQRLRPHICPFETIVDLVPLGSRVLDVGCGAGLFLGLLARQRDVAMGVGFDSDPQAIELARDMVRRHPAGSRLDFRLQDATAPWPEGPFDVVTMIDVMHHIPPAAQAAVIEQVTTRLRPGGLWVYKDMVDRPPWLAWANRLHDLALARQWIHYLPMARALEFAKRAGLNPIRTGSERRYWYGHEFAACELAPSR